MDREADRMLEAVLKADGKVLLEYAFEEEIAANRLTADKLERLFREFILPKQKSVRWAERVPTESNEHAGHAHYFVVNRFGKRSVLGTTVYAVDGAVKAPVLRQIFAAWVQEHYNRYPVPSSNLETAKGVLEGLRNDTERLKALGISAITDANFIKGNVEILPLDELRSKYERWISSMEREASKATQE